MKKGSAKAVPAGKRTAAEKLQYVKKNWQLYVFFLLPALLLTIIFKYVPMGGVLIAFEDYNVIDGVFGSKWVGLEYFRRFLASPDFMNYLVNTLKLSIAVGISDSDHPGTSSESDPESRDQEKNSASDLCAEFYFRYRTLRYGSYVSFTGRSAE